jgi:hypothetical protein
MVKKGERLQVVLPSQLAEDLGGRLPVVLRRGPAGTLWDHKHEDNEEAVMEIGSVSNLLNIPAWTFDGSI